MSFLNSYSAEITIALIVLVVIELGLVLSLNSRLGSVRRTLRSLLTGPNGEDLEALLKQCLAQTQSVKDQTFQLETRHAALTANVKQCVQHIGLVRFDAYSDVSGQQSFSLAMLDGNLNGAIITALFGRTDGRCYGKAVSNGQTEQALSQEESEALAMARQESTGPKSQETTSRRRGSGARL